MVKIDFWIFGYRKIFLPKEKLGPLAGILLRAGIPSSINPDGTLSVREKYIERVKGLFFGKTEYSISEPLGFVGFFLRLRHKKSCFFAALISLLLMILSNSLVWDVRIEGNKRIPDSKIASELGECGLNVGDLFFFVGRGEAFKEISRYQLDKYKPTRQRCLRYSDRKGRKRRLRGKRKDRLL